MPIYLLVDHRCWREAPFGLKHLLGKQARRKDLTTSLVTKVMGTFAMTLLVDLGAQLRICLVGRGAASWSAPARSPWLWEDCAGQCHCQRVWGAFSAGVCPRDRVRHV
eukprot:scaffold238339_cov19-Tisochrysis_lutea.AAC.2